MSRLRLGVLAALAATALAGSPHADAPKQELTPTDVVDTVLWHICNSTDTEETAAVGRAFEFVMAGAGDTADELKSAATFRTALKHHFTDVLAHTEHVAAEVSRDDKAVCVRSDLKTDGQSSAITWCLQKQPETFEACPRCWMIHDFERTPSAQSPSGTVEPHTDDEGFRLPEGRLHLQAGAKAEDASPRGGMSDDFKLGLGIVLGFLTLIAVVVGALLTKLIRQGRAAQNPDVLKLQHNNSIMFSPSKLTGEDWKVPITGSVFGFSPLGKTPSPLSKATDSQSPSPEAEGDLPDKTSPLAKTMLTLNSPEQGKARGVSPDTPAAASASDTPSRRRWFPASPWAV